MKKLISKKAISVAMITGLVAVPSLVVAQVSSDDPANNEVLTSETSQENTVSEDNVTETPAVENTDGSTDDNNGTPVVVGEDDVDSSVTAGQAQAIAEAKFPEKEVARVDLKHEDKGLVYRVRFTDAVKVDVLASDGNIVKIMAEKNQSGLHRQDGANRDSDDDNVGDEVETESRGRSGSNSGRQ